MMEALVTYASWAGSTKEIADRIAKSLEKSGIPARAKPINEKIDLSPYRLIVIGTSIHAGQTSKQFKQFLKKNEKILAKKNIAYFVSCANMMNDNEETRAETTAWLEKSTKKYETIHPVSIGLFGGATITTGDQYKKLNIFIRRIIQAMDKKMVADFGRSDFRDWEKIEAWAYDLTKKVN